MSRIMMCLLSLFVVVMQTSARSEPEGGGGRRQDFVRVGPDAGSADSPPSADLGWDPDPDDAHAEFRQLQF